MRKLILPLTLALCLGGAQAAWAGADVNFNRAGATEIVAGLDGLVDDALARAIVDYRAKNGPFKAPEDLLKVPGMRPVIYNSIGPVKRGQDIVYEDEVPTGMHSY